LSFEFNYRVLSRRKGIKMIYGSETLIDQEQHLALEMSTSKMAHTGIERERERIHLQDNIKAKPEQLKLSKTDPST
jgi:hypothetical protein